MSTWDIINLILTIIAGLLMAYQVLYIVIGLFWKKKFKETDIESSYGVLIAGRNEELVIGQLIDSIKKQNYNQDKIKIFVVADNCSPNDKTAQICREKGAVVFERHNKEKVGKGYALNFLLKNIAKAYPNYNPDGWFVFDADNILDVNYIREMNKAFNSGSGDVVTSYRASKNYGGGICAMGASVGFVRECRFVHTPRTLLNISTHISGTGFLASSKILNPKNGWSYTCITEDAEFSLDNIKMGNKIIYCDDAIFYDEQPTTWKQTYRQRMRWQKGAYLVFSAFSLSYIWRMVKSFSFTFYDNLMYFSPITTVSTGWAILNGFVALIRSFITLLTGAPVVPEILSLLGSLLYSFLMLYLGLFVFGSLAVIKDWKRIKATKKQKLLSMLTYPIFIICLTPIYFIALFKKVEWKPINHTAGVNIEDLNVQEQKSQK